MCSFYLNCLEVYELPHPLKSLHPSYSENTKYSKDALIIKHGMIFTTEINNLFYSKPIKLHNDYFIRNTTPH